MEFIRNIYIDKNIQESKKVLKQLKKNKSISNIYCICIDRKSNSILEIIHSREIFKQVYSTKDYIVIAIASGKKNAMHIVCNIIEDIYKKDNSLSTIKKMVLESLCTKE